VCPLHNAVHTPKEGKAKKKNRLYLVNMQGKKDYQEELFINFEPSEFVPEENL
jgi:hypothetical protein